MHWQVAVSAEMMHQERQVGCRSVVSRCLCIGALINRYRPKWTSPLGKKIPEYGPRNTFLRNFSAVLPWACVYCCNEQSSTGGRVGALAEQRREWWWFSV